MHKGLAINGLQVVDLVWLWGNARGVVEVERVGRENSKRENELEL